MGDKGHRATFTPVPWPKERGKIRQIIAGWGHTVVLTHDNKLWVCGDNTRGQLGLGDEESRLTFTEVAWPAERGPIRQVIAGGNNTLVLTHAHRLWGCGHNAHGQLGLGDQAPRTTFTEVAWPAEQGPIRQVIAGHYHTLVLTDDHRLWVCGRNNWGQLGLGDNENRATFTPVTALPAAMQQVLTLNHTLNQLIKLGTALTQTPDLASGTLRSKRRPDDEPEEQPPLNTLRL